MPYIKQEDRHRIDEGDGPQTAGEVNYAITRLVQKYLHNYTIENYDAFNTVVGVLECCKLELYRRMVAPYENKKVEQNGDVY